MEAVTEFDCSWQHPASAQDVAFELEASLKQSIPYIGGQNVDSDWEAKFSHQKLRVKITVEIVEEFK